MENDKTLNENLHVHDEGDEIKENIHSLKSSKAHPFYAGVCDFYIIATVIAGIIALIESIQNKTILGSNVIIKPLLYLILIVVCIGLVTIYHSVISKKVLWLSLGEKIAGKFIVDNKKEWRNPYNINRWGLFFHCIITLIILGNSFDAASSGYLYTIPSLIGKFLGLFIKIYCLVMIGQGKLKALLVFVGFNTLNIVIAILLHMPIFFKAFFIIMLSIDVIVYFSYYKLSERVKD
ncbi:hypothetical protein [Oceanirhabdus sp. W0125-5]|uniref:hypothetical protein n=1 Tax=Oceanirhabdus sp. W0125-5 TaxID=2999116 RepID=UPI0022F32267|nr:hypothetical protein [Oceanirhabdus sp. W0125-5]WBW96263.1 hypothetical protein OW730_21600 [Oceanirhabdus sp. W0125-5]